MQNLLGYAAIKGGRYSYYTSKALGYTALEDVTESAARILMEGPTKHSGRDYWFSADVLTAKQVAETLAEATGHKFTAAVRTAEAFRSEAQQPGSIFRTGLCKGRARILPLRRRRKNGVRWKSKRRYRENSGARAIVAEGMGKITRQ